MKALADHLAELARALWGLVLTLLLGAMAHEDPTRGGAW